MFSYHVKQIQLLAPFVSQIFLEPVNDVLSYEAGQYVHVIHADKAISPLSIACTPNKKNSLEFHLFHPLQNRKAQELMKMANTEKMWVLAGPFGKCTVDRLDKGRPIIFLGRGTGFAPIKAVIESLIGADVSLHLYWSVTQEEDFYLLDNIEKWRREIPHFKFTPIVAKEVSEADHTNMLLLPEIVLQDYTDFTNTIVYASGPRVLIYAAYYALQKQGLKQVNFYSDVFG